MNGEPDQGEDVLGERPRRDIQDAQNEQELADALFERLVQEIFYDSRELSQNERKNTIALILRALKFARTQP